MTEAAVIDGKALALELHQGVAQAAKGLKAGHGISPGLAVVLVGEDEASRVYVRAKGKSAEEAGLRSFHHGLPEDTSEVDLLALVRDLNGAADVNGILVQLPLPPGINPSAVIGAIDPAKDVDGFHVVNAGLLASGGVGALVPCTPWGCLLLLKHHLGELSGLDALVIGRSNIVGKPLAALLLREHCTVTVAHSRTRDLAAISARADILVAATGRARMVKGDWIKPGATVIDVGINRVPDGDGTRLVGDVDFDAALTVAGAITPVPGGVGPMTIACLLRNTVIAVARQHGLEDPEI